MWTTTPPWTRLYTQTIATTVETSFDAKFTTLTTWSATVTATYLFQPYPDRIEGSHVDEFREVRVGAPPTCDGYFAAGKAIEPNPDISGIGVLLAFLISAWAVWLAIVYAVCRGRIDKDQIKHTDRRFFRITPQCQSLNATLNHSKFHRAILLLSDQQMVTGLAILCAAFADIHSIAPYHYSVAVRLAGLSTTVHMSALLVLRGYLKSRPRHLVLRLSGMVLLFALLIAALVPTHIQPLQETVLGHWWQLWQYLNFDPVTYRAVDSGGVPVACYLQGTASPWFVSLADPKAVISTVLMATNFIWRFLSMFDCSRRTVGYFFWDCPSNHMESWIRKKSSRGIRLYLKRIFVVPLVAMYLIHTVSWDIFGSFVGGIWFITINMATGTSYVFAVRQKQGPSLLESESEWGFGQVLPMGLLILPLLAVFEDYLSSGKRHENEMTSLEARRARFVKASTSLTGSDTSMSETPSIAYGQVHECPSIGANHGEPRMALQSSWAFETASSAATLIDQPAALSTEKELIDEKRICPDQKVVTHVSEVVAPDVTHLSGTFDSTSPSTTLDTQLYSQVSSHAAQTGTEKSAATGLDDIASLLRSSWLYCVLFWEAQAGLLFTVIWLLVLDLSPRYHLVERLDFNEYRLLAIPFAVLPATVILVLPFSRKLIASCMDA